MLSQNLSDPEAPPRMPTPVDEDEGEMLATVHGMKSEYSIEGRVNKGSEGLI